MSILIIKIVQTNHKGSMYRHAWEMLIAGHEPNEPYLYRLLMGMRKGMLNSLISKAKIPIQQSRILIGVWDQSSKLKYGQEKLLYNNSRLLVSAFVEYEVRHIQTMCRRFQAFHLRQVLYISILPSSYLQNGIGQTTNAHPKHSTPSPILIPSSFPMTL